MNSDSITRRQFVATSIALVGSASTALGSTADLTVKDVMDLIIKNAGGVPFANTVDTLKSGTPDQVVTGIVTTMFATVDVINKAIALKANFIIAHEPTFYNHEDKTDFLKSDPVYQHKRDLLEKHGIAVWRCHDYSHSMTPDGTDAGMLQALGWEKYAPNGAVESITIPTTTLEKLVQHLKKSLGQSHMRVIGDLSQSCSKISMLVGAPGGKAQIVANQTFKPDVLICGELSEWETAEYIRDARSAGFSTALIIAGHVATEEPGMKWLASWLAPQIKQVVVTHVPARDPFTWV